ncbi:MAG: carbon-nitrogen hydrolase family protein [Chloroflexi bacterium]|nr:MAG: carbon-nitrogen hydrolase family protein [Chloroflexota bacterium]
MQVNIAVAQCTVAQFDMEANLSKAEHFIQQAVQQKAHIIVFPEDFVTGPLNGNPAYVDGESRYAHHFQRLAVQYAIDIVPGSIIEGAGGKLYNTAYYIDKEGTIRGRYRKVHLWHPERSYLTAGNEHPVFETAYGKVGLIICWDLMFPEVFRVMVRQGVQLVICPSYWCLEDAGVGLLHDAQAEIKLVNALCTARAFEHELVLVYANAAATDNVGNETLLGLSQITVPFKGALVALQHNRESFFVQSVDMAILDDAERAYTIRKDLFE